VEDHRFGCLAPGVSYVSSVSFDILIAACTPGSVAGTLSEAVAESQRPVLVGVRGEVARGVTRLISSAAVVAGRKAPWVGRELLHVLLPADVYRCDIRGYATSELEPGKRKAGVGLVGPAPRGAIIPNRRRNSAPEPAAIRPVD